jgi:hypothetical protein
MGEGGLSGYDENTRRFLATQYGIGEGGAVKDRQALAFNLLREDVNPLWRQGYEDILKRDFTRAQLENPMFVDQPLAWALNRRTGFVSPSLQQRGFGQALQPKFDAAGNIVQGGFGGGGMAR